MDYRELLKADIKLGCCVAIFMQKYQPFVSAFLLKRSKDYTVVSFFTLQLKKS